MKMKKNRPILLPHSIAFRVSPSGKAAIETVADAQGMTPSEYARTRVLDAVGVDVQTRPVARRVLHAEELRQLLAELGRQGSNLNQLVRHLNSGGRAAEMRDVVEILGAEHAKALRAVTLLLVGSAE